MATTKPRATQIRGLAKQQAPILNNLIPDSNLPGSTGNYRLIGEFFVPDMDIVFDGNHTINYITFIDSKNVDVNMTLGMEEDTFGVTLNNGIEAYFPSALLVVLGTVYKPTAQEWTDLTNANSVETDGSFKIKTFNVPHNGLWQKDFDFSKDFSFQFSFKRSPLGNPAVSGNFSAIYLNRKSNSANLFGVRSFRESANLFKTQYYSANSGYTSGPNIGGVTEQAYLDFESKVWEFRFVGDVMRLYIDNAIVKSFTDVVDENLNLSINTSVIDFTNLKYIELAT